MNVRVNGSFFCPSINHRIQLWPNVIRIRPKMTASISLTFLPWRTLEMDHAVHPETNNWMEQLFADLGFTLLQHLSAFTRGKWIWAKAKAKDLHRKEKVCRSAVLLWTWSSHGISSWSHGNKWISMVYPIKTMTKLYGALSPFSWPPSTFLQDAYKSFRFISLVQYVWLLESLEFTHACLRFWRTDQQSKASRHSSTVFESQCQFPAEPWRI